MQSTRITSRNGVNTARLFFEHHGCTFQEVGQQQDFGKDAYVDVADHGGITPLCVALQIKAGTSYRTPNGDYLVPSEGHADLWRRSTVPVFGIVQDPDDDLLRWIDLTGYLRAHPVGIGRALSEKGYTAISANTRNVAKAKLASRLLRGGLGRMFLLAYIGKKGYEMYRARQRRLSYT